MMSMQGRLETGRLRGMESAETMLAIFKLMWYSMKRYSSCWKKKLYMNWAEKN